jgi:hypothetical protein
MKMEQSVPKRRHIKFRRRGITQKNAYELKNITILVSVYILFLRNWPDDDRHTTSKLAARQ